MHLRHQFVLGLKRILYGACGEPYRIKCHTLRFLPGTRPVRMRYVGSRNSSARYDALQVLWLTTQLNDSDFALDIGAHCGVYSILMAAKCGQAGHVVAFEPDPCSRELLAQNLRLNPQIKRPRNRRGDTIQPRRQFAIFARTLCGGISVRTPI